MTTAKPSEPDYYDTLGLSPSASPQEVRRAFSDLVRKHREAPGETNPQVIDRARQINIAHQTLGDPTKRRAYDASRGIFFAQPSEQSAQMERGDDLRRSAIRRSPRPSLEQAPIFMDGKNERTSAPRPPASEKLPEENAVATNEQAEDGVEAREPVRPHGSRAWKVAAVVAGLAMFAGLMTRTFEPRQSSIPITAASPRAPDFGKQAEPDSRVANTSPADASASPGATLDVPYYAGAGSRPEVVTSFRPAAAVVDASRTRNDRSQPKLAVGRDGPQNLPTEQPLVRPEPSNRPVASKTKASPENSPFAPTHSNNVPSAVQAANGDSTIPQPRSAPPAVRSMAKSAEYVSGDLVSKDAPVGRLKGTVSVRFTVDREGRANRCQPTGGSGNAALGSITCQLVEDRLRFSPARDAAGRPTPSELSTTYNWMGKPKP